VQRRLKIKKRKSGIFPIFKLIFFVRHTYEKSVAFFPKIEYNLGIKSRRTQLMSDWDFEMWWDAVNGMEEEENYDDMDDW
jgi:hypothetical protein